MCAIVEPMEVTIALLESHCSAKLSLCPTDVIEIGQPNSRLSCALLSACENFVLILPRHAYLFPRTLLLGDPGLSPLAMLSRSPLSPTLRSTSSSMVPALMSPSCSILCRKCPCKTSLVKRHWSTEATLLCLLF